VGVVVGSWCGFGIGFFVAVVAVVVGGGGCGEICCSRVVSVQLVSVVFDLGAQESMVLAIGNHTTLVIYIHLRPCFHFRSFDPAAPFAAAAAARDYHLGSAAD